MKETYQEIKTITYNLFCEALEKAMFTIKPSFQNFIEEMYYKKPNCIEVSLLALPQETADEYITLYKKDFRNHYGFDIADKKTKETILCYLMEE